MYVTEDCNGSQGLQTRADDLTTELWASARGRRELMQHSLIMGCYSTSDHTPHKGSDRSQRNPSKHLVPPFLRGDPQHHPQVEGRV